MDKKTIVIDCERMKHAFTGLHEFSDKLSRALIRNRDERHQLVFYVPEKEKGFAGDDEQYFIQHSLQKFFNPGAARYDIWHCTYQSSMYYPRVKKQKKLLTIHDLNLLYDTRKSAARKKKYLQDIQDKINKSDQLTVISNFTLQSIQENLDLKNVPVEVVYNGCNIDLQKTPPAKPSFLNEDDKYLFTIGTIALKKNFHVLPCLLVNNDYKLVIAGIVQDEAYLKTIKAEAKKYNVQDRLILPGPVTVNEKWWLMQHAMAFFFPSISEGFGMPVVEALNFGIPVILSDHTCLPEIGGNAAYYFKSFDAEDMQNTLTQSLAHFHNTPGQDGVVLQRARTFDWNVTAKAYWRLYNKLANP